ncbi:MAG TPA: hypothetical protein K8V15_04120, partial [Tessaracoccus flavescens]|nr:hypothetical protein [Tessaracoccus flavescens]
MASNWVRRLRDLADERRRSRLLTDVQREQASLRPGYKIWGYKNVFAKGFLLTREATAYSPRDNWLHSRFGRWHLQHDPLLAVQEAGTDELGVMVLGEAFDDGGPTSRAGVAAALQRIL